MRLSDELSMDVIWYGQYACRAQWEAILKGLEATILQINGEQGDPDENVDQLSYAHLFTQITFFDEEKPGFPSMQDAHISRRDAIKASKTIKDLFFVYKDGPRKFLARLNIRGQSQVYLNIGWKWESPDAWPKRLPAELTIPIWDQHWDLLIQRYGRGADPPLTNDFREALGWSIHNLTTEGPQTGGVSKQSYNHAFVKLHLDELRPEGLTRADMIQSLKGIKKLIFAPYIFGSQENSNIRSWLITFLW